MGGSGGLRQGRICAETCEGEKDQKGTKDRHKIVTLQNAETGIIENRR